jgi:hypothetical protein
MTYNYRSIVNHVLRKTEFTPVSETIDSQFTGTNIDPFVDRVKDWTNEVYLEICNAGYWRFLETEASFSTVNNQENYSLAADCQPGKIIDFRETHTPSILSRIDFKDIDKRFPDTSKTTNMIPQYYYFVGNTLFLYPIPDRTLTIKYRYYKAVSDLVDPTDVPLIPEHWKWVLVNGILIRANQYLQDQSVTDIQFQYMNGLIQMRAANRADRMKRNSIQPY